METFTVKTTARADLVEITAKVSEALGGLGAREGLCHVYCPHTTAGITINENADPDVERDFLSHLEGLVPKNGDFRHGEGNSDAHIKSMLTGAGQTVPVSGGRLMLGTWQGIFLCEFDGPRTGWGCSSSTRRSGGGGGTRWPAGPRPGRGWGSPKPRSSFCSPCSCRGSPTRSPAGSSRTPRTGCSSPTRGP